MLARSWEDSWGELAHRGTLAHHEGELVGVELGVLERLCREHSGAVDNDEQVRFRAHDELGVGAQALLQTDRGNSVSLAGGWAVM